MNGIKILPVPCRITLPLAYTLTEKEKNKTHAIANKKKYARQKVARARISLIRLPQWYIRSGPFVFLLLAVYRLKNRLRCNSTKIQHGYQRQANLKQTVNFMGNIKGKIIVGKRTVGLI